MVVERRQRRFRPGPPRKWAVAQKRRLEELIDFTLCSPRIASISCKTREEKRFLEERHRHNSSSSSSSCSSSCSSSSCTRSKARAFKRMLAAATETQQPDTRKMRGYALSPLLQTSSTTRRRRAAAGGDCKRFRRRHNSSRGR